MADGYDIVTNAQRVTIVGGSAGGGDGTIIDGVDANIKATVKDLSNSNPLATQIVDASGDAITSFGGGTQYTEDAAAAANPVGTALNLVRDDALGGSLTTADGDNVAARGNNKGEQYVKDTDAGTSLAVIDDWDESDRAKVNLIVGQAGVQGGSGAVSNTTQRVVLATDVALPAGTNAIGKLSANSGVDIGDTDVTSVVPGTGATNLGKAIDTATGATDTGVLALVTRDDALSTLTPADGDNTTLRVDSTGAAWTRETLAPAYEDNTNSKAIVEHRYTSSGVLAADTQVKSGAGLLHTVTISCNDAAPTAGSIIIYDNTAESGTQIFNHTFTTTPFMPFTLIFDVTFATGLYVGFTTTADVNVTVSYR